MKCCLCGRPIVGFGNNPEPLSLKDDERCCDECNMNYVLGARMFELEQKRPLSEEEVAIIRSGIREKTK